MKPIILLNRIAQQKTIDFILLNLYSLADVSLYWGKAGVSLTLFELARYTKNEIYEDYGYELLREILVYDVKSKTLASGSAGIGYLLQYLIKFQFIDADYNELYAEKHQEVLKEIYDNAENLTYNKFDFADYLFFVGFFAEGIQDDEKEKLKDIILFNILNNFLFYEIEDYLKPGQINDFYNYSSKVLSICNIIDFEKEDLVRILAKIIRVHLTLSKADIICDVPEFGMNMLICGIKNNYKNIIELGQQYIKSSMQNLHLGNLDFKQKIDVAFRLFYIYGLDHRLDYRSNVYKLISYWSDKDIDTYENNIYRSICTGTFPKIGYGEGLSRLLLLQIYWDEIQNNHYLNRLIQLFK